MPMCFIEKMKATGNQKIAGRDEFVLCENFPEVRRHREPRALVGRLVIADTGHPEAVGVGVGETVLGAAVRCKLPVSTGRGHLFLKRRDLLGGDERVVGAVTNEDLRLYLTRLRGLAGLQAAVKADDTAQRCAVARQLERESSAHAESDRRKAR